MPEAAFNRRRPTSETVWTGWLAPRDGVTSQLVDGWKTMGWRVWPWGAMRRDRDGAQIGGQEGPWVWAGPCVGAV